MRTFNCSWWIDVNEWALRVGWPERRREEWVVGTLSFLCRKSEIICILLLKYGFDEVMIHCPFLAYKLLFLALYFRSGKTRTDVGRGWRLDFILRVSELIASLGKSTLQTDPTLHLLIRAFPLRCGLGAFRIGEPDPRKIPFTNFIHYLLRSSFSEFQIQVFTKVEKCFFLTIGDSVPLGDNRWQSFSFFISCKENKFCLIIMGENFEWNFSELTPHA